jgi:hypothetical protein
MRRLCESRGLPSFLQLLTDAAGGTYHLLTIVQFTHFISLISAVSISYSH